MTVDLGDGEGPGGRQFNQCAAKECCSDSEAGVAGSSGDASCLERSTYGDVSTDSSDDYEPRARLRQRVLRVRAVRYDQHPQKAYIQVMKAYFQV